MSQIAEQPSASVGDAAQPDNRSGVSPIRRAWNDVPLRVKVSLLLILALVSGALIGMLEVQWGRPSWILSLGLTSVALVLLLVAKLWIGTPFEHLVQRLQGIAHDYRPGDMNALPLDRRDEVGQIARLVHRLASTCLRDYQDAQQLRRTLDHRVAEATRRATRELQQMAMRDALTNLGNRRFLDVHLEPLIESIRESDGALACVAIDIDNFKPVNDTLGHAAGDDLLRFLASLIRTSIRTEDYAVRLGGDEFVVLIPGCTADRAKAFATQLIALFRQHVQATLPAHCPASLSIGITTLSDIGAGNGGDLIHRADEALYAAKRAGKNQVACG